MGEYEEIEKKIIDELEPVLVTVEQKVKMITLPDGREAMVTMVITADEDNFF